MTLASLYLRPASAAFMMAMTYLWAAPASPSSAELAHLAQPLQFNSEVLGEGPLGRDDAFQMREVHPSLDRIAAWISAVGAAVALTDLDGDRLPNDACHVDPRTDTVTVRPVPADARR